MVESQPADERDESYTHDILSPLRGENDLLIGSNYTVGFNLLVIRSFCTTLNLFSHRRMHGK